jgi:hypothetical protein
MYGRVTAIMAWVWHQSHVFGFSTFFGNDGVDVVTKAPAPAPAVDGSYVKGGPASSHMDRLIQLADGDRVDIGPRELLNMALSNTFGRNFSAGGTKYKIHHPIRFHTKSVRDTIPDEVVIRPQTSSGPMRIPPMSLFYADADDIVEFSTNLTYPDTPIRFAIKGHPWLLYDEPVDIIDETPPDARRGGADGAETLDPVVTPPNISAYVRPLKLHFTGMRDVLITVDDIDVRLDYGY